MMMMSSIRRLWFLLLAWIVSTCWSYPVIIQVDEDAERCFRFTIPEDDDGHLIAIPIPNEEEIEDEDFELWYVEQVYKMTKMKDSDERARFIPKKIPDEQPEKVALQYGYYLQEKGSNQSKLKVKITRTPASRPTDFHYVSHAKYFLPVVVNQIRKMTGNRRGHKDHANHKRSADEELEGFGVCFSNLDSDRQVNVVFDIVYVDEKIVDEEESGTLQKDRHLTPLEESLDLSIQAANAVLREMKYMETRERRMKETAVNINNRVHYLSYLSIAVLFVVTFVQVSYLKRYFTKKKLM